LIQKTDEYRANIQVHTFGIGEDADEQFITDIALTGAGMFNQVRRLNEVGQVVDQYLSKRSVEYLIVKKGELLDEDETRILSLTPLPKILKPGHLYRHD